MKAKAEGAWRICRGDGAGPQEHPVVRSVRWELRSCRVPRESTGCNCKRSSIGSRNTSRSSTAGCGWWNSGPGRPQSKSSFAHVPTVMRPVPAADGKAPVTTGCRCGGLSSSRCGGWRCIFCMRCGGWIARVAA